MKKIAIVLAFIISITSSVSIVLAQQNVSGPFSVEGAIAINGTGINMRLNLKGKIFDEQGDKTEYAVELDLIYKDYQMKNEETIIYVTDVEGTVSEKPLQSEAIVVGDSISISGDTGTWNLMFELNEGLGKGTLSFQGTEEESVLVSKDFVFLFIYDSETGAISLDVSFPRGIPSITEDACIICVRGIEQHELSLIGINFYAEGGFTVLKNESTLGDVDMNGEVDAKDFVKIKRSCFDTYQLTSAEIVNADINGDGRVSSLDYILCKRICFGTYVP